MGACLDKFAAISSSKGTEEESTMIAVIVIRDKRSEIGNARIIRVISHQRSHKRAGRLELRSVGHVKSSDEMVMKILSVKFRCSV